MKLPAKTQADPFAMPKAHQRKSWSAAATYDGTHGAAKHKWYCKARPAPDVAKCARTMKGAEALALVQSGLDLGLVRTDVRNTDRFPRRVYAFRADAKGRKEWFEAKRTFPDKGEYHGYPIPAKSVPQVILDRVK